MVAEMVGRDRGRAKPVIHAIRMMGGESILDGHNTLRAYNALPTREEANRLRGHGCHVVQY